MEPAAQRASWFDGRSSRAQPVLVRLRPGRRAPVLQLWDPADAGRLLLESEGDQVGWPERFSRSRPPSRLTVDLREHGSLQLDDVSGWQHAFEAAGGTPSFAERMQTRLPVFAAVLLAAVVCAWTFYRFGVPFVAVQLTRHVPLSWELRLADAALRQLDAGHLRASRLPAGRQADLRAGFERLIARIDPADGRRAGDPRWQLQFRAGLGANAFALPGGTVVITDGLVDLATRRGLPDEALLGVLAHEIGHVMHRHATRMVVEQGVLNVGLGQMMGDMSWALSSSATLLTGLAYRRNHEGEADCFAMGLMHQAGLPTGPTAALLRGLEAAAADRPAAGRAAGDAGAASGAGWAALLSTHPLTAERATRLERGDAGC
jgi:Zn-dependent protease with chaperone function